MTNVNHITRSPASEYVNGRTVNQAGISYMQYIVAFLVALASVHGFFVYHFGLPADMVYSRSVSLLLTAGFLLFRKIIKK